MREATFVSIICSIRELCISSINQKIGKRIIQNSSEASKPKSLSMVVNIDLGYSCLREFHLSLTSKPKSLSMVVKIDLGYSCLREFHLSFTSKLKGLNMVVKIDLG